MNLKDLVVWVEENQDLKVIRGLVRKDSRTQLPRESDINIALKMLGEIKKRALLVENHLKNAERYQSDISEYLLSLETRGIKYPVGGVVKEEFKEEIVDEEKSYEPGEAQASRKKEYRSAKRQ